MKRIIKILISLIFTFGISGCTIANSYQKDSSEGYVLVKDYDEIIEMKESNEKFIVLFTLSDCPYCKNIHEMLSTYLSIHHVIINEVILDLSFDQDDITSHVESDFPQLKYVPTIYLIEDNKVYDKFTYDENDDLEDVFDQWVQKNELDIHAEDN